MFAIIARVHKTTNAPHRAGHRAVKFIGALIVKGFGILNQYPIIAFPVCSNAKYSFKYILVLLKWQSKDTNRIFCTVFTVLFVP